MAETPIHRLTADTVHGMVEAGLLREDDRIELLDGQLIEMPPIGPLHRHLTNRITKLFILRLAEEGLDDTIEVNVQQSPLRIDDYNELGPDISLTPTLGTARNPLAREALLVIEVSVSSREYDLAEKRAVYERARVPQYVVIDAENRLVLDFRCVDDRFQKRVLGDLEKVLEFKEVAIRPLPSSEIFEGF